MADPLLSLHDARVTYRRRAEAFEALRGVSMQVRPGQRIGVVGGSGSGKTTLARLLVGLVGPSAGEVRFCGNRVDGLPESRLGDLRASVSMVFQDPRSSLDPRMRLRDIVAEPLRSPLLRVRPDVPPDNEESISRVMAAVGLGPDLLTRFAHQLSGGQRQRLAIARALVSEPLALIADEPVSALDVSVRAQVLNLLAALVAQRQLALVFVSHDLAVVRHLCDRVVVVEAGRIVEHGRVARVFADPQHPYTRRLLDASLSL
ncbi:MAG: ABC transporter ATP-binding protein [Arachnia sp.]